MIDSENKKSASTHGLINVLGQGLKYITGSMDDEKVVNEAITEINNIEQSTKNMLIKLIPNNNGMTE